MAQTGRFFKCLSQKGKESAQVKNYFTIGEIYAEADVDFTGQNLARFSDSVLLLYINKTIPVIEEDGTISETKVSLYVSAMDFEYIKDVTTIHLN